MSFAIYTDTSANLPLALAQDNSIGVLPFSYFIDGAEHQCLDPAMPAFDGEAYYAQIRLGACVTTSLVTPEKYLSAFRPVLQAGEDVLFVGMSSGISGSFNCARLAAEELRAEFPQRHIELVDTIGASLGEGIIALRASALRRDGLDIIDAALLLRETSRRMCQVFTVDDLMHLRRGGRLSNISAIVGTVLNIKPLLKGDAEGKIVAFQKVRGRKKSINAIATIYAENVTEPERQTVGIAHAACAEDAAYLAELITALKPPREILTVQYEPVTGAHVGPGALALFFLSDSGVRDRL